jgi:hypothetical protein
MRETEIRRARNGLTASRPAAAKPPAVDTRPPRAGAWCDFTDLAKANCHHCKEIAMSSKVNYAPEILSDRDDDGTMPENVAALAEAVVGHRIVSVDRDVTIPASARSWYGSTTGTALTLDNGKRVFLVDKSDCCAYTDLEAFLLHADRIDHLITGVGTTDGFTRWHIFADMGDVPELTVGWSCGNPFYYGYGFEITVVDADPAAQ